MTDFETTAKKAGITINLTGRAQNLVQSGATPCVATQPSCAWQAADWGSGWIYADPYLPTGEVLFSAGATTNFGSYSSPEANTLINESISAPASQESRVLGQYAQYMAKQLPVIYTPTSIGIYSSNAGTLISSKLGGYAANAFTYLTPEQWYLTK